MKYEVGPSDIVEGEFGVFAKKTIKKGDFVGHMSGVELEADKVVDPTHVLWIDSVPLLITNETRYINHSQNPNCTLEGLVLYASRNIKKGSELSWDYGQDFQAELDK